MLLIFNSSIFTMGVRTMFEWKEERRDRGKGKTREHRVLWISSASRRENEPRHIRMDGSKCVVELYFSLSLSLSFSQDVMPPCVSNLHNPESTRDALPQGIQVERLSVRIESLQCYKENRHDILKFYRIFSFASVNNSASFQRTLKFNYEKMYINNF